MKFDPTVVFDAAFDGEQSVGSCIRTAAPRPFNPKKGNASLGSAFLRLFAIRLVCARGWPAGLGFNNHSKVISNLRTKMMPIGVAASINNPERRCPDGFKLAFGLFVFAPNIQRVGMIRTRGSENE